MNRFTVEETNLMCIYAANSKQGLVANMTAAFDYMDEDMRELARRTLSKVDALSETEFTELTLYPADEV